MCTLLLSCSAAQWEWGGGMGESFRVLFAQPPSGVLGDVHRGSTAHNNSHWIS